MAKKKTDNYGEGLERLEKIVHKLEEEDLELDDMVSAVEEGLELAEQLKGHLENAENRVKKLKQKYKVDSRDADEVV